MHPAARALRALRFGDGDGEAGEVRAAADNRAFFRLFIGNGDVRDDEELGEVHAGHGLDGLGGGCVDGGQGDVRLKRFADALVGAGRFQHAVDVRAEAEREVPRGHAVGGEGVVRVWLGHLVEDDVARVVAGAVRHLEPDLVAGEGEDRREELRHRVEDHPERGLCAAAGGGICAVAVEVILDDVEVEAGERDDAEVVDGVGDGEELIVLVGRLAAGHQVVQLRDGPAVELRHVGGRGEVVRVKVDEVVEAEFRGVAELEIVLAQLLEDGVGAADVDMIVGRACPEAADVSAVFLEHVGGIDAVAEGFVHGLALAVDGPAVRDALFERSALAQCADGGQQRGLEPAAILVEALQIDGRGPEALILLHGGEVRGAGVEPAVERVGLLVEVLAAAVRADEVFGDEFVGLALEPDVRAEFAEELRDVGDGLVGADRLAAVLAVEHRDRQAPAALTRDAPVGALADHGLHAVDAPAGDPADVVARGAGLVLERVDRAEPLRRGAEDDRLLAAPAMRIAVDDLFGGEEAARFFHVLQDDGVGLFDEHPLVLAGIVGMAALIVDGDDHVHAVAAAGLIVVGAEAGCSVDAAGTGIHRDVIGQDKAAGLRQEGMIGQHVLIEAARMGLDDAVMLDIAHAHDLLGQRLGNDIHLTVVLVLHDGIALAWVQRDGEVAGERPNRGRPDHEVQLGLVEVAQLAEVVVHGELDIDGGAGVVLIFDLGLGQGGLVVVAPVDGLQALIDIALLVHRAKDLDLFGLEAGVHGLVRMLPIAKDAEALEALHLHIDIMLGKIVAGGAEGRDGHLLAVQLVLLDDGGLDRHAVVVPAGDVGRIIAAHCRGADHEVLDALVERMAHVERAVRERRAVVQGEAGLAVVFLEQLVVEVHVVPLLEHIRLAHRQAAAHREAGFAHVERLFVFHVKFSFEHIFI